MAPDAWRLFTITTTTVRAALSSDTVWTRLLFTGSQSWQKRRDYIEPYLEALLLGAAAGSPDGNRLTLVHGGAPGADRMMMVIGRRYGIQQSIYPVNAHERAQYGHKAPLQRDARMVAHGASVAIGVPDPLSRTGGTWETLRLARQAGIPTFYLTTDGGMWNLAPFRVRGRGVRQTERLL